MHAKIISPVKRLLKKCRSSNKPQSEHIIPVSTHELSPKKIPKNVLQIIYRLQDAQFEAYVVGGGIRDLLLHHTPKDFDIATNASLRQIKKLFRNCRLIGRRFRIAHIFFNREIIEVTTFPAEEKKEATRGIIKNDAKRRDFTVNALYYNPYTHTITDFFNGLDDLHQKIIRIIGNPKKRYEEDPVRMLRAARFAGKLGFTISPETEKPIFKMGHLLSTIAPARLFDETLKLFYSGHAKAVIQQLLHLNLFKELLKQPFECMDCDNHNFAYRLYMNMIHNTDQRIAIGKPVAPTFLFAVFLWPPLLATLETLKDDPLPASLKFYQATKKVIRLQAQQTTLPRRITLGIQEIWSLQARLTKRRPKQVLQTLHHPRFRAAYDLLLLRAESGEDLKKIAEWWTKIQTVDEDKQEEMINKLSRKQLRY